MSQNDGDLVVEFVFSSSDDGLIHSVQVQSTEPLTHEEFLQALGEYVSGELTLAEGEELH